MEGELNIFHEAYPYVLVCFSDSRTISSLPTKDIPTKDLAGKRYNIGHYPPHTHTPILRNTIHPSIPGLCDKCRARAQQCILGIPALVYELNSVKTFGENTEMGR